MYDVVTGNLELFDPVGRPADPAFHYALAETWAIVGKSSVDRGKFGPLGR